MLCNGPAAAGKGFNRSLTQGQLDLPGNIRCRIDGAGSVPWSSIRPIVTLTGDPELAFSNAYARMLERRLTRVTRAEILAAERSIIAARFNYSRRAYLAAIAEAHTSLAVARGVIEDELRRARIASKFRVRTPGGDDIAEFQQTYADLPARLVQAAKRAPWLGGRKVGYAVQSNAPGPLMELPSLRWTSVWSPSGVVRVRPLGPPVSLGSVAPARAPWIAAKQSASFHDVVCWRDQLPQPGIADLTEYLPFLALSS
jgi:hypothetical protein